MTTQSHPESVVILWRTPKNQTLWQLRDADEQIFYPNHWGLFGGGQEPEESPTQAALRELKEETGLVPELIWKLGTFTHPQLPLIHGFLVEAVLDLSAIDLGEGVDFGLFDDDQVLSGSLTSPKTGTSFPVVGPIVDLFRQVKANQFLRFPQTPVELQDQ